MPRTALALLTALLTLPMAAAAEQPQSTVSGKLTLEQIMADPDWIGPAVEDPYWSADGSTIYFELKRTGSAIRDLHRINPAAGGITKVEDEALADADGPPLFDAAHRRAAFVRHGDVFIRDLATGELVQVTRTPEDESRLRWTAGDRGVQFKRGNDWFRYALNGGGAVDVAALKAEDNPHEEDKTPLEEKQLRYFESLREIEANEQAERDRESVLDRLDDSRSGSPFYLGKDVKIIDSSLSPNGRWMLAVTESADYQQGTQPVVNHYVTVSGYSKAEETRTYVGRNPPAPQSLVLLDLAEHKQYELSLELLPGIHDDPLAKLRKAAQKRLREAGQEDQAKELEAPDTRGVRIADQAPAMIEWSDDGTQVAIQLHAIDNKDRWIASVDLAAHKLVAQHRLHDPAWINWLFNGFGFLHDSHKLWYLSEESGYSHLYVKPLDGEPRQLGDGAFEVSNPILSEDNRWFYVRANREAPYRYEMYRVPVAGGAMQQLTEMGGVENFVLSPDGGRVAVLHSGFYVPSQLSVIDADGGNARRLTHTLTDEYKSHDWIEPEIAKLPSTHFDGSIYAKLYKAPGFDPSVSHPAVLFVHGAGYLQDVDTGWSHYFREQMFNNILAREGYVVLDMDYRASEGYGRDWRTAIYRHMGHPELEDLLDGKAWLVANHHVDPDRVGIYGGSYGGFMTFMALLRAPGEFAAGAAVRPVADWTSYNHGYTSNILNTPLLDPEAYRVSSPIEFAENLADPLLICHGLVDWNVLPDGAIRLYQRFIELRKDDFWMSLYPMEAHGFVHADSWYDEYRRIHELFTRFVRSTDQPPD